MIREQYDVPTQPLAPIAQPRHINPYALDLLGVAARLIVVLAAIAAGIVIVARSSNDGIAVLAAFACAGVIYGLLSPARTRDTTTEQVYYVRIGNRIVQLRGDETFDKWHGGK